MTQALPDRHLSVTSSGDPDRLQEFGLELVTILAGTWINFPMPMELQSVKEPDAGVEGGRVEGGPWLWMAGWTPWRAVADSARERGYGAWRGGFEVTGTIAHPFIPEPRPGRSSRECHYGLFPLHVPQVMLGPFGGRVCTT